MKITNFPECDLISEVHNPIEIGEDSDAVRVYCKNCFNVYVIGKSANGAPEKKQYAELFKRWVLQGNNPLFYKIYPQHLKQ